MDLLRRIERYLSRTGAKPTVFGRAVMNDPAFVRQLRNGREPRPETVERVSDWLEAAERNPGAASCGK